MTEPDPPPPDVVERVADEVVARTLTPDQATAVNEIRGDFWGRLEPPDHNRAVNLIVEATGLPSTAADWLLSRDPAAVAGQLPDEAFDGGSVDG